MTIDLICTVLFLLIIAVITGLAIYVLLKYRNILVRLNDADEVKLIKMQLDRELEEYKRTHAATDTKFGEGDNMAESQNATDALVPKIVDLLKENKLTYGEAVAVLSKANVEIQKCRII